MARLYLFRHGETEWNREHRFQGRGDADLTQKGVADLRSIAKHIQDVAFDYVYCSTLGRARKSLDILAPRSARDIVYDDRLREIGLGVLEGMRYDQLEPPYDTLYEAFLRNPPAFQAEGAESFGEVRDRVYSFIDELDNSAESILVMAHGVVLKMFLAFLRDRDLEHLWGDPHLYNATLVIGRVDADSHELLEVIHPDSVVAAEQR